ncbi:MAG TPA: hypothetical protein VFG05_06075 [Methylocella sp.]|nr:hypothetical protein [Methylocella sp.]
MDVAFFLKLLPGVLGAAGLLTYFTSARKPDSDLEIVNIVRGVRRAFVIAGCAALILLSVWLINKPQPPDYGFLFPDGHPVAAARQLA